MPSSRGSDFSTARTTSSPAVGFGAVWIEEVIERAVVAKATLYHAGEGDREAARRARSLARLLIEQHRP